MKTENLSFERIPFAISEILARVQKIETLIEATPTETAETTATEPEPFIYGITGLAKFLKCSLPTAQKIKNSGRIPFSQAERTIIFKKAEVLSALSNTNKKRR